MKLLTRNTDYAVRAICYLAGHDKEVVAVPELVKALKIPKPFLRKILQVLNKEGVIRSQKGIGGGFLLAKPAGKIFLVDLIRIFQGPIKLNECILQKKICPNIRACPLKKKIASIEQHVTKELNAITIGSLLR